MTDEKTKAAEQKAAPKRTVDLIDFTKPISITMYQTETRNNIEVFTGEDHAADAERHAAGLALNSGKTVAVFGPQTKVKIPPKEPQADDLELAFGAPAVVEFKRSVSGANFKKEGNDLVDQDTGKIVSEGTEGS